MEFLAQYNLTGIVIGVATFLIIGIFHPLVIKGEYWFGVKIWWLFLVMGVAAVIGSIAVRHLLWSTLLAVWGVALVHRRAVRTAQARGQRLVSQKSQPEIGVTPAAASGYQPEVRAAYGAFVE